MIVKNLNFIVTESIDGHFLLNIRLQEFLPTGKEKNSSKTLYFLIFDPPPKNWSHFFWGGNLIFFVPLPPF